MAIALLWLWLGLMGQKKAPVLPPPDNSIGSAVIESPDGKIVVAKCARVTEEGELANCTLEPGHTLDEVLTAMLLAEQKATKPSDCKMSLAMNEDPWKR